MFVCIILLQNVYCLYQKEQQFDIHWHDGGPSIAMVFHLRRVPNPRSVLWQKVYYYVIWHDDVIKWKHLPRYWPFVRGIHRSPVNSPHKGQWCGALMFSLICARINGWVNNREAGDLRRLRAHYDVIVMKDVLHCYIFFKWNKIIRVRVQGKARYPKLHPLVFLSNTDQPADFQHTFC